MRAARESREPAIHRLLVSEITFPEPRFQSGFLYENDIQMEQHQYCNGKKQNRERALIETESHQHYEPSDVHWISNEPVRAHGDKFTRRIEDGRRTSSPHNKDPCTRKHDQRAGCADEDPGNSGPRW